MKILKKKTQKREAPKMKDQNIGVLFQKIGKKVYVFSIEGSVTSIYSLEEAA